MKTFTYTINDPVGIHARPAGILVKSAKGFESSITLSKDGKTADLKKLMALMALGVKCGDSVTITAEGNDEDAALDAVKKEFEASL